MQNEPVVERLEIEDDELFIEETVVKPRMAFLILNIGMQPAVFDVVKDLKERGYILDWSDPESYHITMVGFYCGDETPTLEYPPFGQGYGVTASSLGVFNNEDGTSLHLAVDDDMLLKDYQTMLAGLVRWNGYELSEYSEPGMWKPHITLGYSETPIEALPILPESVVVPTGAVALSVQEPIEDDFEIVEVKSLYERFVDAVNTLFGRKQSIDFSEDTGFKVFRNGRWVAWYTNAYQDRDGEWFSEKSIKDDIARMNTTKEFPELWFWHIPGTRMGQADAAMKVGRFAIATGTFDDNPYGQWMKSYLKRQGKAYILSHGFKFPRVALVDGVYHVHSTFEISPLLATKASNPLTFFAVEEGSNMNTKSIDPEALAVFSKVLEGSGINPLKLVEQGLEATKQADEATGHNYKGVSEVNEDIKAMREDMQMLTKAVSALVELQTKAAAVPKGDPEDDETEGDAEAEMKPKRKSAEEQRIEALEAKLKAFEEAEAAKATSIQGMTFEAIAQDYLSRGGANKQQQQTATPFGGAVESALKAMNGGNNQ